MWPGRLELRHAFWCVSFSFSCLLVCFFWRARFLLNSQLRDPHVSSLQLLLVSSSLSFLFLKITSCVEDLSRGPESVGIELGFLDWKMSLGRKSLVVWSDARGRELIVRLAVLTVLWRRCDLLHCHQPNVDMLVCVIPSDSQSVVDVFNSGRKIR